MVTDSALVVRPNRDSPGNGGVAGPMAYGDLWMRSVLNSLMWRGGTRRQLYGDHAIGGEFTAATGSLNPSLVVGCGHGGPDIWVGQYITGQGYSTLLTTANAGLMAKRVVYLLSCLTAQSLGPEMIGKGAVAYAGYNQEFVWTVESPWSPATDRLAAPFGRVATMFPRVLDGSKIVREAKERTLEVFEQEIERWEKSSDPYAREVVKWLLWDRDAFTVLGDEEARGLEPKLATGLVLSIAGVGALAYGIYRYRRGRR